MHNNSRGANGRRDLGTQVNSHGGGDPETIDLLAVWIAEDVVAFAKSFDAVPAEALRKAVEQIHAESMLEEALIGIRKKRDRGL